MNQLFNSISENSYNYVLFILLLFFAYIFIAALIKITTECIVKIIVTIRTPEKLINNQLHNQLDKSEKSF